MKVGPVEPEARDEEEERQPDGDGVPAQFAGPVRARTLRIGPRGRLRRSGWVHRTGRTVGWRGTRVPLQVSRSDAVWHPRPWSLVAVIWAPASRHCGRPRTDASWR